MPVVPVKTHPVEIMNRRPPWKIWPTAARLLWPPTRTPRGPRRPSTRWGATPVGNSVNGYIDNRFTFQRAKVDGLLSTRDLAQINDLIELNVQLKHTYTAAGFVYGDMSAFGQYAGSYRGARRPG